MEIDNILLVEDINLPSWAYNKMFNVKVIRIVRYTDLTHIVVINNKYLYSIGFVNIDRLDDVCKICDLGDKYYCSKKCFYVCKHSKILSEIKKAKGRNIFLTELNYVQPYIKFSHFIIKFILKLSC